MQVVIRLVASHTGHVFGRFPVDILISREPSEKESEFTMQLLTLPWQEMVAGIE